MKSEWESGKYGAGQAGREHYKSRVMNVMHIDFFFHYRRQKQEEMKGFFQVEEEEEEQWLAHASNIFPSIKKTEQVGSSSGKSASRHAVIKLLSGLWTMFQLHVCATH